MYEEALARVRGQAGNALFISLRILRNCVSSRWSSSSRKTVQRLRSSLTVIMTKALEDGHAQFVARSAEDLTLTYPVAARTLGFSVVPSGHKTWGVV